MTHDEILRLLQRPTWMVDAACRGLDPDLFFPHRGADVDGPRQICRGCDVQVECLTHAMNTGEHVGIWGGMSERERRRLRRQHNLAVPVVLKPIDHGTAAGYATHLRRGEEPCPRCREANTVTAAWRNEQAGRTNHHTRTVAS